eukprot:403345936
MTTAYKTLEVSPLTKSYLYPYIENKQTNEIQFLMRESLDKNSVYEDFGDSLNHKEDGNMLQGLARSLLTKSYGLITHPNSLKRVIQQQDAEEIVKTFYEKVSQESIIHFKDMTQIYKAICHQNTIRIIQGESIIVGFQLNDFNLNIVNDFLKQQEKQQFTLLSIEQLSQQESFSVIHLENLMKVSKKVEKQQTHRVDMNIQSNSTDYSSQHGSIDYELPIVPHQHSETELLLTSSNLESLKPPQESQELPDYAVMVYDEREHYENVYEMFFMGNFIQNGNEKWAFYKAYNLEFPSEEVLANLKGLVLPGSKYSVYDDSNEWIEPLKEFVRNVYNNYKQIKVVGICFGHQLIAQSLGGKTQKMIPGEEECLYIGKEEITLKDSFYEIPAVKQVMKEFGLENTKLEGPLIINAVHQDHVLIPPPNAIVHGSSQRTEVELYTIEDRVFTFQAHPEFSQHQMKEFVVNKMHKLGRMNDERREKLLKEFNDDRLVNRQFILTVLRTFLKSSS